MQKYVIAGLCASLALMCWLYRGEVESHADTKASLAVAEAVNESNQAEISRLERSMANTDKILAGWNADRTTLAGVRSATRQAIKEAMRDETFKAWASSSAPDDAFRLLGQAFGEDGNHSSGSAGRPADGLPGNSDPGKRE